MNCLTNNLITQGKIGILGGTFNPIHKGHMHIAKASLEYGLDQVWLMPNAIPPHKASYDISSQARLDMINCALDDFLKENPSLAGKITLYTKELDSTEPNYTYQTLEMIKELYSDIEIFFIIGQDSLDNFKTWVKPDVISSLADMLVAVRTKCNEEATFSEINKICLEYSKEFEGDFIPMECKPLDATSTDIRNMVASNSDLSQLLFDSQIKYIREHRLYEDSMEYDFKEIESNLKEVLRDRRYDHTIGVMHTAANLAMKYNLDINVARLAGLLHDCGKYMSNDELLDYCQNKGIEISQAEQRAPHLLHAKVGANIAKETYNITDTDIIMAIKSHTTGRMGMTLLEKIIFVADYIEPGRDFHTKSNNLSEIRNTAYENIDKAIVLILKETITYLEDNNCNIDNTTIDTLEYYKQLI